MIRGQELEERGFGGIYGVGKAAANPPALAVLSHTPQVFVELLFAVLFLKQSNDIFKQGATRTVAWVGKGIVYDTGGLSIKGKVCFSRFPT